MSINGISFKGSYHVSMDSKTCGKEECNKIFDSKIEKIIQRKVCTNQLLSYFQSEAGKAQLERIPEFDEIIIAPLQDNDMEGDGEIDNSSLELNYIECDQEGENKGELKRFSDCKVPQQITTLKFNDDNPFNLKKVVEWLSQISTCHKQ